MKPVKSLHRRLALLAGVAVMSAAVQLNAADGPPDSAPAIIEMRGRLLPFSPGTREVKFKTESGAVHTVLSNRMSSALFIDTNLQTKTLLLKGRAWAGTGSFEVTGNLRSVREGRVHELFYYCDICAIKGIDPGPCMCCRDPVRLVEELPGAE